MKKTIPLLFGSLSDEEITKLIENAIKEYELDGKRIIAQEPIEVTITKVIGLYWTVTDLKGEENE
jgi:hypothetical protein